MMRDIEDLVWSYERAVARLPDKITPDGEMENILDGRDLIEESRSKLSSAHQERLAEADARLRKYAAEVDTLLGRDPKKYREKHKLPKSYWWWYVDLIAAGRYEEAAA